MKKILIATIVALSVTGATAAELGLKSTRDFGAERNGAGFTFGHKVGSLPLELGVERFAAGAVDQTRFDLRTAFPLVKVLGVSVSAVGGGAYLDNSRGNDGFAAVAGVGLGLPLTKSMSLDVQAVRQFGQDRVKSHDANLVSAGLKVKF